MDTPVETSHPGHRRPKWKPNYRIVSDPQHPNCTTTKTVVLYGPRKPLREVRRELQALKEDADGVV